MFRNVEADNPQSIETVAALARTIWTRHYTPLIGGAQVTYMLGKFQSPAAIAAQLASGVRYYLLTDAEAAVGYLALVPNAADASLMLSKIYVLPEYQGRGLGRAAVAFAEHVGAELGLRRLWLTVNKHNASSLAFYARVGFVRADEVVTDIGGGFVMDDYILEKRLPGPV